MDIYEKKYKDLVDRFDVILNLNTVKETGVISVSDVRDLIPELKESEDEKIRKELIDYLKERKSQESYGQYVLRFNRWIEWLEKQGEQKDINHFELKSGHWYICHHPYCCRADHLTVKEGEKFMCEKDNVVKGFAIKHPELYFIEVNSPATFEGEQKPDDKVEPKFKVGDWVIYEKYDERDIDRIVKLDNDKVSFESGEWLYIDQLNEDCKLWTIQDAKDGDILNSVRVNATIIFKSFAEDGKHIVAYCALQKGIFIKQEMLWDRDFDPSPKSWKEELFLEMKEAGYVWDNEKKELKKIEQNLAWSEEDKKYANIVVSVLDSPSAEGLYSFHKVKSNDVINWIKSLKERVQPKQEWSEEDENMLNNIIGDYSNYEFASFGRPCKKIISWLKSLKDRVQPQSIVYYNPYKEVIESIDEMCKHYDKASHSGLQDFYDNVKVKCKDAKEYDSLYPQNTWKPSEEQMKGIDCAIKTLRHQLNVEDKRLNSLYEQLKKL